MKSFQKYFFGFAIVTSLLLPQPAIAQREQCDFLKNQINNAGGIGELPEYCTTGEVYNKFIKVALYAIGIVAIIAVIYGGYIYMTAGANEVQRKKGRQVLTWAIVGLAIVLLATVIINVVVRLLV